MSKSCQQKKLKITFEGQKMFKFILNNLKHGTSYANIK